MRPLLSFVLFGFVLLVTSLQTGCALVGATIGAATNGRQGARRGFELGAGIDGAVVAVAAANRRRRHRLVHDDGHAQSSRLLFYRCQAAQEPQEPRYYQVEHGAEASRECEAHFGKRCVCEESS